MAVSRRPRLGTIVLVVLAVGVVGAAVVDSVGHSLFKRQTAAAVHKTPPVVALRLADRSGLAAQLRRHDVDGVLYFVESDCRLHALRLPSLEAAPAPQAGGCRALVSPASAPPGWSLWPRNTPLAARCEDGHVIVSAAAGPPLPMIGGCAPAWRPDGSMTYIRRGAVVQFPRTGRAQVLRSRSQLADALQRVPALHGLYGWSAIRVAWLGPARFAVLASTLSRTVLVVFSGRRIVALRSHVAGDIEELRASPRGRYIVLGTARAMRVYDARRRDLPQVHSFGSPLSVAWSSDERWSARAGDQSVLLVGPQRRLVLPVRALDLAWTRALS